MVASGSDAIFQFLKNEEDAEMILKKGEMAKRRRAGRQGVPRRKLKRKTQELLVEKDQVLLIETTDGSSTELPLPAGSRVSLKSIDMDLKPQGAEAQAQKR